MTNFKAGDRVRIADNHFNAHDVGTGSGVYGHLNVGDVGTLEGYGSSVNCFDFFRESDGALGEGMSIMRFEKVETPEAPVKVGDRVRVTYAMYDSIPVGTITTVAEVKARCALLMRPGRLCSLADFVPHEDAYTFFFDWFEKVEEEAPATPFQVGDKVRILQSPYWGTHQAGDVGTVVDADFPHGAIVNVPGGQNLDRNGLFMRTEELEKITQEEAPKAPKPAFKVGDKVRVINTDLFVSDRFMGQTGTISGVRVFAAADQPVYEVTFEIDWDTAVESELELVVEEASAASFKVGNRVRYIETTWADFGTLGTVIGNDGSNYMPLQVQFDGDDDFFWVHPSEVEAVTEEAPKAPEGFQDGARVKIVGRKDGATRPELIGLTGTVYNDVSHFLGTVYPYRVVFDGEPVLLGGVHGIWFVAEEVVALDAETQEEKSFEVGDRVRVIKDVSDPSNPTEIGSVGVVISTDWDMYDGFPLLVTMDNGRYYACSPEELEKIENDEDEDDFDFDMNEGLDDEDNFDMDEVLRAIFGR